MNASEPRLSFLRLLLGAAPVLFLNLYVIRDVFFLQYTGHMNSMHGFWMAMARLADTQWTSPGWWPYCDGGMPFEHLYAPLTPWLMAAIAKLRGIPVSQAFYAVTGLFYVLGPLTLYAFAAWLTRSIGFGIAAALCYSLLSPSSLLIPDAAFRMSELFLDRRAYLMGSWDETPHMASLVILPVLWIFLIRALRWGRRLDQAIAIALMSLATVGTAFGPVGAALSCAGLCLTVGREKLGQSLGRCLAMGIAAWLIALPWLPPSLIASIGVNAKAHGESGWNATAVSTVSLLILALVSVSHFAQKWTSDWRTHFVAFLACVTACLPAFWVFLGRTVVPQAGRYRMEMDLAWALLLVVVGQAAWRRLPRAVAAATALVLACLVVEQVVQHRRYAKAVFAPHNIADTLDYEVARFMDTQTPPGGRVFLVGSMAPWFNAFSDREQFSGSSFSTAFNQVQQIAMQYVQASDRAAVSKDLLWLKAFGVQAIAVPGKNSPETWHPVQDPSKFDGILEQTWKNRDTAIFRVPTRSASLAHVVAEMSIVRHKPLDGHHTEEVARYVSELENANRPEASWRWISPGKAEARAQVSAGEALSVQVSYHPGWHARVNGVETRVHADGLGLLWLKPAQSGAIDVQLSYDGGLEAKACRSISFASMALLGAYTLVGIPRRRRENMELRS